MNSTLSPFASYVISSTKHDFHTEFGACVELLCPFSMDVSVARDALLISKVAWAHSVTPYRGSETSFSVGDGVYLSTTQYSSSIRISQRSN
jgi:hypothetical protein